MTLKVKLASAALAGLLTLGVGGVAVAGMHDGPGRFGRADANKDGQITRAEWMQTATARFDRLDADKDGKLTAAEMPRHHGRGGPHRGHHGPRGGAPDWDRGGPPSPGAPTPAAPATPTPQK